MVQVDKTYDLKIVTSKFFHLILMLCFKSVRKGIVLEINKSVKYFYI